MSDTTEETEANTDNTNGSHDENGKEKERVLNEIIALGLNTFAQHIGNQYAAYSTIDKLALVDKFSRQHFDKIIPCFEMLDPKIQVRIFMPHKVAFLEFMKKSSEGI